ncbi:hypothetical protein [Enemella sp. A6]|uniref:hypothetical protein n=1 Tax=Enemella sp. A6 TaxID=3440152 RepID=UPI003EB75F30
MVDFTTRMNAVLQSVSLSAKRPWLYGERAHAATTGFNPFIRPDVFGPTEV